MAAIYKLATPPKPHRDFCGTVDTKWIPDTLFGMDLVPACKAHDKSTKKARFALQKIWGDILFGFRIFKIEKSPISALVGLVYWAGVNVPMAWRHWRKLKDD